MKNFILKQNSEEKIKCMNMMGYILMIFGLVLLGLYFSCGTNQKHLPKTNKLQHGFSRNGDTIALLDQVLNGIDAESFEVMDEYFCKDKTQVFFYKTYRESKDYFINKKQKVHPLELADPLTFDVLGYGYAKDKNHLWYLDHQFTVRDLPSFSPIDAHFSKDRYAVYLDLKSVEGIDGSSFELVDGHYARDSKNYYYYTSNGDGSYRIKAIPCDYPSFVIIDYEFSKDQKKVFFQGKLIPSAEASSFKYLTCQYSKDVSRVYFNDVEIQGADPESFELFVENENSMGSMYYARDKEHVYVNEQIFKNVHPGSFKIFNENYTTDLQKVYYQMKHIKNADPKTFKVYPHDLGDADAEDKNGKFSKGLKIENRD